MDILNAITAVFSAIFDWFIEAITSVMGLFYTAEGGLTIIGVLTIISLGIALVMLIINIVRNFLTLRR